MYDIIAKLGGYCGLVAIWKISDGKQYSSFWWIITILVLIGIISLGIELFKEDIK